MKFDSFSAFLAMDGHGLYVWLCYGVGFFVFLCMLMFSLRKRSTIAKEVYQLSRRNQSNKSTGKAGLMSATVMPDIQGVEQGESVPKEIDN